MLWEQNGRAAAVQRPRSGREGTSLRRLLAHEQAGSDLEALDMQLGAADVSAAKEADAQGANITGVLPADVGDLLLRVRHRVAAVHSWLHDARTLLKLPGPNVTALAEPSPGSDFSTSEQPGMNQSDSDTTVEADASNLTTKHRGPFGRSSKRFNFIKANNFPEGPSIRFVAYVN